MRLTNFLELWPEPRERDKPVSSWKKIASLHFLASNRGQKFSVQIQQFLFLKRKCCWNIFWLERIESIYDFFSKSKCKEQTYFELNIFVFCFSPSYFTSASEHLEGPSSTRPIDAGFFSCECLKVRRSSFFSCWCQLTENLFREP